MSEGTTQETKLTDSEAKMLRELAVKHGLINIVGPAEPLECALAFGSELLLAAKEKAARSICQLCRDNVPFANVPNKFVHKGDREAGQGLFMDCKANEIRRASWSDLFEVK